MGELIIRDGQDGTIGATTDAAIISDAAGTLSGKLRGLVKILANVWDSGEGRVKVSIPVSSVIAYPHGSITYGYSLYHHAISGASTNATNVKASAGGIGMLMLYNTSNATCFFKLYNKASAPVVGTDTPLLTIAVPPGIPTGLNQWFNMRFTVGVAYAATALAPDNDTTAIGAGDLIINISYI